MFAPELSTLAIALAAITQWPDGGGAAGPVKPAARQGRSEAEWLDRAEDRRTIVGVMAVTCGHQVLSARTHETNGTRGLEVCEEVTLGERLKGVDSVRVRVHLYERCFRRTCQVCCCR